MIFNLVKVETKQNGQYTNIITTFKSQKGKEFKVSTNVDALDETSKKFLRPLNGQSVDLKVNADVNKDGKFWSLNSISEATQEQLQQAAEKKAQYNNNKGGSYDNTGVKVGAARNQAIAYLAAVKDKFNLNDVDEAAYEILERQAAMEKNYKDGINPFEEETKNQQEQDTQDALENDDDVPF
jgi:hypothetical protein